jgi:hypothetical protein
MKGKKNKKNTKVVENENLGYTDEEIKKILENDLGINDVKFEYIPKLKKYFENKEIPKIFVKKNLKLDDTFTQAESYV